MISHAKRCIFIHIPKTAGTSIEQLLGNFDELERGAQDHRTLREIQALDWRDCASVLVQEGPLRLAREVRGLYRYPVRISKKELNDYFKFSFVRNPWARVHSWYRNVMRDEIHQQTRGIPAGCSLYRFLTEFGWQTELRPQLDWLTDRQGRIGMDYIGQFENLSHDLKVIAEKLETNVDELPHLITSKKSDYRNEYDAASRKLVATRYATEIGMFGYTFDQDDPSPRGE